MKANFRIATIAASVALTVIASGLLAAGYWRELMYTVGALLAIALVLFSGRSGTGDSRNTRIAAPRPTS